MKTKLKENIVIAMKAGEKELLATLKMIMNEINVKEKETQKEMSETEIVALLKNMKKKREESIVLYKKGNREDLVTIEQNEINVIETYLPAQMTEEEVIAIVDGVIEEVKPESMRDMGKVLGPIKAKYGAVIDMALVSKLVKGKIA